MRQNRRFAGLIAALCAAILWTLTPARGVAADAPDTLRIISWQAPTVFNPHLTSGHKDWEALRIVYEPLATADREGNLIPVLAAEIPSRENGGVAVDGRSVTWKLKEDVVWSDGTPFTAADVRFTHAFITDPGRDAPTRYAYDVIERVEIPDPHTVRLVFRRPNPAWGVLFVGSEGMILPRHAAAAEEGHSDRRIADVGTGPFRMTGVGVKDTILVGDDVVSMVEIRYSANPRFREPGKPFFRRIIYRGGGDAAMAARDVLVEGDADFAWNLQVDEDRLREMAADGNGRVLLPATSYVERILLNFTDPDRATETGERSSLRFPHPFFSDIRVRNAFAHAVDRRAIAALYGGAGRPATNILVAPARYRSPNTAGLCPYDLDRAAALLDEAGWTDTDGDGIRDKEGVPMRVLFQTSVNRIRQETQAIVKRSLTAIGVDVELKVIDASVFFSGDPTNPNTFGHFYADMQEFSVGNRLPDPTAYMAHWLKSEIAQAANDWSGVNYARWSHPEYERLYALVAAEFDPAVRRDLFIRLNDLLIREAAVIPLVNRATAIGVAEDLSGIDPIPWDRSTWNIRNWRRNRTPP
jgi:peptide/nickel transport system substrate-binding protein